MTKPSSPNTKRRTRATTTKKKTSPVAKKPTNKKQSSGKKKDVLNLKYWAFEMKGTGKEEYFDDIQEAKEFQISFGDIIEKTRKFSTKPQWVARKKEILVQRMVKEGAEMMIGAINDPTFGHVIVCGSGGVLVDLLADSTCRLHPVTDRDAGEMVEGLKGVRLLRGFRGGVAADEVAFRDAILRVSALVGICPEIQELDLNPLMVLPEGVSAVDVRVRVDAAPQRRGTPGAVS